MEIRVDISDWEQEYQASGVRFANADDMLEYATQEPPLRLGRFALVARERGDCAKDTIKPNKLLLNLGAALNVSCQIKAATVRDSETGVRVRRFVGPLTSYDGRFAEVDTLLAAQRAHEYLMHQVPQHVRSRLDVLRYHGGDVRKEVRALKKALDEMVAEMERAEVMLTPEAA